MQSATIRALPSQLAKRLAGSGVVGNFRALP